MFKDNNHLGILGWLFGGSWGINRYLFTLHRLTGLGMVFFFINHIFVSSTRCFGFYIWDKIMLILNSPIFKIGEFIIFIFFIFHALNGLRLILVEFGLAVGKATEPVYPYQSSLDVQHSLVIMVLCFSFVIILIGAYNMFFC